MFSKKSLLLFAVFLFANCSVGPKQSLQSEDRYRVSEITLERSGSWGLKSGYKVIFRKEGAAEYLGDVHATRTGNYQGKISTDQFEQLTRLIIKNDFFSLADKYHALVTDTDTVITTVIYAGGHKAVEDFGRGGGDGLTEIEMAIDKAAEVIVWTKR